jgi:hypothetical protein
MVRLAPMAYYYTRQVRGWETYVVSPSRVVVFHEASQHARAQEHLLDTSVHDFLREEILRK